MHLMIKRSLTTRTTFGDCMAFDIEFHFFKGKLALLCYGKEWVVLFSMRVWMWFGLILY